MGENTGSSFGLNTDFVNMVTWLVSYCGYVFLLGQSLILQKLQLLQNAVQGLMGYKLNGLKPAGPCFRRYRNTNDVTESDSAASCLGTPGVCKKIKFWI